MSSLLEKLPTMLMLGVLLGIFFSLRKHAKSRTINLWIVAWGLILAHFVAQAFEALPGWRGQLSSIIDLAGLELSGLVLIASTMPALVKSETWRRLFFLVVGLPLLLQSILAGASLDFPWTYVGCLALIFYGSSLLWLRINRRPSEWGWAFLATLFVLGTWTIYEGLHHDYEDSITVILTLGFALPSVGFYRIYRRWSPGALTTFLGFFCWGAVFPAGVLADHFLPKLVLNPDLWNVPKFIVAFGMIVTLLEEKSVSLAQAIEREHEANQQMEKFAQITSKLLMGADARLMCQESAEVIVGFSNFQRVAILLGDDEGKLQIAGHGGLSQAALEELREKVVGWSTTDVSNLCAIGRPIGANSFLLKYAQLAKYNPVRSAEQYELNPYWENGDEIFVPLRFSSGRVLGSISLDDPRDVARVTAQEMSKIELLAADLSASRENSTLQRQLILSEKLAAIGKLVAGVAHELNNPLTSIAGYTELLLDDAAQEPVRQKLEKIGRESKRMQRIIDNLLRFARRKTIENAPIDLEAILHDALALYDYKLKSINVDVRTSIHPVVARVFGDEDHLKQVFVNLLSNAVEAVQDMPEKRIMVEMFARGDKVLVRFLDSGPGFADLSRAFDPFYTTRPVGKGIGLGLSTCYGMVKQHGGEIYAENIQPTGAVVTVELPRSQPNPFAVAATAGK